MTQKPAHVKDHYERGNRLISGGFHFMIGLAVFLFISSTIAFFVNHNNPNQKAMTCTVANKTTVIDDYGDSVPVLETSCGTFFVNNEDKWNDAATGSTYTMYVSENVFGVGSTIHDLKFKD